MPCRRTSRLSAALVNSWVLVLGATALALSFAVTEEAFAALVHRTFLSYLPELPERLREEFTLFQKLLGAGGVLSCIAWLSASLAGIGIADWLLGAERGRQADWIRVLLLAATLNCAAFVLYRGIRDWVRIARLSGLSFLDRKSALFSENSFERNFEAERAFLGRSPAPRGNLVLLRRPGEDPEGRWPNDIILHYSAHLFPMRVYLSDTPNCSPEDLPPGWAGARDVRWFARDCGESFHFDPEPLTRGGGKP